MKNGRKEIGIIGLGRMGSSLALNAREKGYAVAGVNKGEVPEELFQAGVQIVDTARQLCDVLEAPRVIFLYIPAGNPVESVTASLAEMLESGDVIVDGGNSYWGESVLRHAGLKKRGIHFVDLGTSGGIQGARYGACFMAGGEDEAVRLVEPVLLDLAEKGGYVHAGPPGAGHFTKLVHNGIEFGMLQAIGEGMDLLERFREPLKIAEILSAWGHGSVIRSWLIELMGGTYRQNKGMDAVPGYVEDTGEVNWLIDDALKMEVPIPVISASVMQLFASRDSRKNWARAVAMMRHGFGGHPYGPDKDLERFRRESRVEAGPQLPVSR